MKNTFINNSYDKLLDEITLSTYISFYRKDVESVVLGLFYDERISEKIKYEISILLSEYLNSKTPILNNLIIFLLAYIKKDKIKFPSGRLPEIRNIIDSLIKNEIFPIGQKAHINYMLLKINGFKDQKNELNLHLTKKSNEYFNTGNIEGGILASYSLINNAFLQKHLKFCENFIEENITGFEGLSRLSTFVKSTIYIARNDESNNQFGAKMESILSKSLKYDKSPDLWFAISESEKIINSNLEDDINQKIIEIIKSSGNNWSKLITNIHSDGITVNIKNAVQFAPPSVIDAFYSLQTIELFNRDYVFSLPIEKADEFKNFTSKSELSTNYKSIYILCGFVGVSFLLITIILTKYGGIVNAVKIFYETKVNPKSLKDILIFLSNPIAIIGIILWWICIVFKKITPVYNITVFQIIMDNPIILYLRKFFNNIKPKK